MNESNEWTILIALFRSTVEQTNMLHGKTKHECKLIFNRWVKEGYKLLNHIEKLSDPDYLEEVTEKIENSINDIRNESEL